MYVATAVLGWTGAPLVWRAKSAPARSVVVSQVNSDSRATGEYMDFLLGKVTHDVKEDCPSVIVGGGRIGSMLLDFGKRRSYDDVLVKRGDPIPADHPGPVYVCTQAADLEAVIAACPDEKKDDLVFLQDGMLEPLFQRHGIYGPTQVALWMAQVRVGGKPVDGVTPDAPQGLTTVSGKWAGAVAMRLGTGNLNCEVKMERDGRRSVLERLIFVTAYNLVGVVTGGKDGDPLTVGEVASRHDASKIEFARTSLSPDDFAFRSGYFYRLSKMAGKRTTPDGRKVDIPDGTPLHTEYLEYAAELGLISQATLDDVVPPA